MATAKFNRKAEDLGNIISLEHVNLRVPDQSLATWFYVSGLGLTRDPFVDFGTHNVWINAGNEQFHLPTGKAQVLRGEIHLVVPDLDELERRLGRIQAPLRNSQFIYKRNKASLSVRCPWGNHIRCQAETQTRRLGIQALEFKVEAEKLPGIERFYNLIFNAPTRRTSARLTVTVGLNQQLIFAAGKKVPKYDGHHIAIYCPDFSGPYSLIKKRKMISEESDQHQYRFDKIFDPKDGKVLYELEHEVRSLHHPMFNRKLTNRNPGQTFANYFPGRDHYYPNRPGK
ncbi:MAG: VOC family protein [Pseudomonadales bacterium]